MKLYVLVLFCFALLLLNGCAVTSSYAYIEEYEMGISPAPELRGAGEYLKADTSSLRLSGHVNIGPSGKDKRSSIKNELINCNGLTNCDGFDTVYVAPYVHAEHEITYPIVTLALDYVHKWDLILMGFGLGMDRGAYFDVLLGFNTKYFEVGAVAGMWMMARKFRYSGTEYECTKYYRSDDEDVVANFDFPLVLTGHATAAYRINKHWEARLGAVNFTSKFPDKHISVNGGASYYL